MWINWLREERQPWNNSEGSEKSQQNLNSEVFNAIYNTLATTSV
jgi:hypothetical protein